MSLENYPQWKTLLYLDTQQFFVGRGFGFRCESGGEVIFNTGMSGYEEIFTDPSYCDQIVVMTSSHIGNTGINFEDAESSFPRLKGIIVRNYHSMPSSWRSQKNLHDFLFDSKIMGLSDVDTRHITQIIRDKGSCRGFLLPMAENQSIESSIKIAQEKLSQIADMQGSELVSKVSCVEPYHFNPDDSHLPKVMLYDFGVKKNILNSIAQLGFQVEVVPHLYPFEDVLKSNPKMVVLSNGPGDPGSVAPSVTHSISQLISKVPILAICMGHQLLARSFNCQTYKLKFGHHGINHPVRDERNQKVYITSQNHGFCVSKEDLEKQGLKISFVSLNDQTVEGFYNDSMKLESIQFHPEASPGPTEGIQIIQQFMERHLK